MNIQVAILAGGYGTRLKEITLNLPKPMVRVNGIPFLEYLIKWLLKFKFNKSLLMVGHLGDQIENYFGDGRQWHLNISYSYESPPMGTAGALKQAEGQLEERFLLLNGDTFLPIDYGIFMRQFVKSDRDVVIAAYDNTERVADNNLELSSGHIIKQYGGLGGNLTHVDAGAYGFKRKVIESLPAGKVMGLDSVYQRLILEKRLAACPTNQRYYDIGTPERLETFRKWVAGNKP